MTAGLPQNAVAAPSLMHPVTMTVALEQAAKGASSISGIRDEVDQGFNLLSKGKQAMAVNLFDRVIATVDRHLAGDSRQKLCDGDGHIKADLAGTVIVDKAVCDAHFGKGYALIDLGRGDLAEAELHMATTMAPGDAHYANEYAELFKSRREWQKSYDLFARAWNVVDKDMKGPDASLAARALRGMGYNMIELGKLDEAEKLFRQSLDYEPRSDAAKGELSYLARKRAIGS